LSVEPMWTCVIGCGSSVIGLSSFRKLGLTTPSLPIWKAFCVSGSTKVAGQLSTENIFPALTYEAPDGILP